MTEDTFIVIQEERNWFNGDSLYDWDSPDPVARMTLQVDDFNHGDLRVRVIDAAGRTIFSRLYKSVDSYWYVNGEFTDIDFTDGGQPGLWTIVLDYREFTGDVRLTLESLSDPSPPPPEEVDPPTEISDLLDDTYGDDGRATYASMTAGGRRVALDSSDRSVVVGTTIDEVGRRQLAAWRFLENGGLDTSFGEDGVYLYDESLASAGYDVVIDSSDRPIICGWTSDDEETTDLLVLRLTTDGELDEANFGPGGTVVVDDGEDEIGAALAIDFLGRILVAGTTIDVDTEDGRGIVVRLSASGVQDGAFAGGLARTTDNGDRAWDIAGDGLGRPIVVGVSGDRMALWKFSTTGASDLTFGGGDGKITSGGAGQVRFGRALAIRSDGLIAVSGFRLTDSGSDPTELALWLYNSNGTARSQFSGNGFQSYEFATGWAVGLDVAFDSDGALVVSGTTRSTGVPQTDASATLWRYSDTGVLDGTLDGSGGSGVARYDARSDNVGTGASGLAIAADGSVITVGGVNDRETSAIDLVVWKLEP